MDTWHEELGSIWDLGKREMKSGYTQEQLTEGVINGDRGYVVFVSKTTGKYLYFYYEPMAVNEWRIGLSVPEDIVFQDAVKIKNVLRTVTVFEAACLLGYFLWMIIYVKNETEEKQRQLDMIRYIYDVEKLLFTAHLEKENIEKALGKIGDMTTARLTYFRVFEDGEKDRIYIWSREKAFRDTAIGKSELFVSFPENKESVLLYKDNSLRQTEPQLYAQLEQNELHSLMLTQIRDEDDHIVGMLGAVNMNRRFRSSERLENVALSFSMLCYNAKSFAIIKEMGERDVLTGLLNRNSFETSLETYQHSYKDSLASIYVDVNGLHQLNNAKGHEEGDRMLRCVANEMQSKLGGKGMYRIGGDEFLVFVADREESAIREQVRELKEALKQKGYYVSVGISIKYAVDSVDDLVKDSERNMYMEKRRFYEENGEACR